MWLCPKRSTGITACRCKSDDLCKKGNCYCKKQHLPCGIFCACKHSCQNPLGHNYEKDESFDSER